MQELASFGKKLFDSDEGRSGIEPKDAVALMHWLELTRYHMRCMRWFFESQNLPGFPTTNQLLDARKFYRPTVEPILEGKGVAVDEEELIRETTEATVKLYSRPDAQSGDLRIVFKEGGDGAGGQTVWKSKKMNDAKHNIFQYSVVPLRLETTADPPVTVWKNQAPNSPDSLRAGC